MRIKIAILCIGIGMVPFNKSEAQQGDTIFIRSRPRNKEFYDKPGHYEMVALLDNTEINPGDTFNVSLFFSGYGEIGSSKVYFKANKNIFLDTGCYISGGLSGDKNNHVFWTAVKDSISGFFGGVMPLGGLKMRNYPEWGGSTSFIDLDTNSKSIHIFPENSIDQHPPYYFHLSARDDIEAGPYVVTLVFTYFNGQEWAGQQIQLNFKVKNIIERNPGWAWVIGILAVLIAFIGIIPIVGELGKKFVHKIFRNKPSLTAIPVPPPTTIFNSPNPLKAKKKP
jgi:hypothetical protein